MEPVSVVAALAAVGGVGVGWRSRQRVRRAEAEAARLRRQLHAAHHDASHDPLTGLPNRRAFNQLGTALIGDATRHPLAAAVIDLDDFKDVNDKHGHAAGDEVLITVAARLATCAGDNLVARLGGDEFAALLCVPSIDQPTLDRVARTLAVIVSEPMRISRGTAAVTASVGVVPVYASGQLTDALRRADEAMYRVKATWRGQAVRFAEPPDYRLGRPFVTAPPAHTHHADDLARASRHLVDNTPRAEAGG